MSDLIIHVSERNYKSEILDNNTLVLVDFWAEWCGPCRSLEPTLEEIAKERVGKLKICKVNVDENPTLASQLNIRSIPYMALIKDGQKVAELVGNQPKQAILKVVDSLVVTK